MNKEGGIYYNLNGNFIRTILTPIEIEQEQPTYLLAAVSLNAENEIHLLEMSDSDNVYNCLINIKIDATISDCKVISTSGKLFLFGIGTPFNVGLNDESVYFCTELHIQRIRQGTFSPKISLKYKNIAMNQLDHLESNIYVLSDYSVYKYNLNDMKFELFYDNYKKSDTGVFTSIKADKKNKKLYIGQYNNIIILDQNLQDIRTLEKAHDMAVNCIDINVNKNNQILTTANENFLKFWDIRKIDQPNLVITDTQSFITSASFNSFYDQLVLYSLDNGSVSLISTNSISSSVILKLNDNEKMPDNKRLKTMEAALDDYVDNVSWNNQDAWIFGASSKNKAYFDVIQQNIRFEVMF